MPAFILPRRLHVEGKKGKTAEPTKEKNVIIKHHTNIHEMNVRSKNSVCFNVRMGNEQEKKLNLGGKNPAQTAKQQ